MQNYGQHQAGYQGPASTSASGTGPAIPPPYGAPQGYQTATPQTQSQWAPPTQNQMPAQQQWNQPQQQAGGYNPGVYGVMPGGYSLPQQGHAQASAAYTPQQDIPPPPPPKPASFTATPQPQNTQTWGQQTGYGAQQPPQRYQTPQQNPEFVAQGQQEGYMQQNGHQPYSNPAPPPPSQTPSGSYFPPPQIPQAGGRPGSIYGAEQQGMYSTPPSAVSQQPPNSVLTPNEQNPVYVPPSLTGQGVQSYLPSNTNPMAGVYVPPPPDVPAWQQASHAPLQGGKKFRYTKPAPVPNTYEQSPQGNQSLQAQGQYGQQPTQQPQQYDQQQYPPAQAPPPAQFGNAAQNPYSQGQYGNGAHEHQAQFSGLPAPSYRLPQDQSGQAQPYQQQPQSQWQPTPLDQAHPQQQPGVQAFYNAQQQTWQPGHQTQGSVTQQQFSHGIEQGIQAPTPVSRQTGTTPPGFVNEPSPQSQPVSPLQNRFSTSFSQGQAGLGRAGSISSIALGAIHAQRAGNISESPKPIPAKPPAPPPRDDVTKFSALGTGGPSDWEYFGGAEEVDDEELFGTKKDGRQGVPVQLDSVEVPLQQVSPSQTQGQWPTPPVQLATADISNRDIYQPSPPQDVALYRPPSQPPQQNFVMSDVQPSQTHHQSLIMGDPTATSRPSQQTQQDNVIEDAVVSPLRVSQPSSQQNTPSQQQSGHLPPSATSDPSAVGDGSLNISSQPVVPSNHHEITVAHAAELKAKDNALERLQTDFEKEKAVLRTEVEHLKVVIETTKTHAEYERNVLIEQMNTMKTAVEQASTTSSFLAKEKDSTIERLKEDAEGKEDTIREKESEITKLREELKAKEDTITKSHTYSDDLKNQLNAKDSEISSFKQRIDENQTTEGLVNDLREQLEAEKSKELSKPTPASLVPDLDPWYAGSLERYITMLRSEAHEPLVEGKIKVFTGFLKAESEARGLAYYDAPPSTPHAQQQQQQQQEYTQPTRESPGDFNAHNNSKSISVQVPSASSLDDETQYSPGGRPIVRCKPSSRSEEPTHPRQSFSVSSQSTTVLTPTSSQDDSFSKTPTPLQSPPAEPQAQPQYKAYIPSSVTQTESIQNLHRQSISSGSPSVLSATTFHGSKDEVFFGASPATTVLSSRPNTGGSAGPDTPVPAPLFTPHQAAIATKAITKSDPVEKLTKLLPDKASTPQPNPQLESIRKRLLDLSLDSPSLQSLTSPWEKSTSLIRKKNDDARRKRQQESEQETDQLFNDHEISYADIAVIEDEFKTKESDLQAEENRNEYQSYVETVFDNVYDGLQQQIKKFMDTYIEVESLGPTAVSGLKSFEGSNAAITLDCLKLMEDLFEKIEQRHEKVVEAVAERDKRYKKTQIQPLYAAGNITKMKQVEKHFAQAERDAIQRALSEKSDRVEDFIHVIETTVMEAVSVEQQEIEEIIGATRDLPSSPNHENLLARAKETVLALSASSKSLLQFLNDIEINIGGSVLKAQLAGAKMDKQADKVVQLEKQILDHEKSLLEEFKRKEAVLNQDGEEIDKVIKGKGNQPAEGGGVELSDEEIKKARLNKALEAAKRRNGDL